MTAVSSQDKFDFSSYHFFEVVENDAITPEFDAAMRSLLFLCYQKDFFEQRRYNRKMPNLRFCISIDGPTEGVPTLPDGRSLIAHVGLHEISVAIQKSIEVGESSSNCTMVVGGICEVCTHPAHRRKGLAERLLSLAADYCERKGFPFIMLFTGQPWIYRSSGYVHVPNVVSSQPPHAPFDTAMVRSLAVPKDWSLISAPSWAMFASTSKPECCEKEHWMWPDASVRVLLDDKF